MKLYICQINTIIGNLEYNKKKILDGYKKGAELGVDLVVFPELALVGYPPLDLVEKKEFREAVAKAANEIASQTNDTGLIFGTITADDDNIGTDVFNSAVLCYDGKIKFVQPKSLIPNYDVFDEMRYFDAAAAVEVFEFKGEKLGISVCEDIWNDADYWHIRRYNFDPVEKQVDEGATLLINISASPYSYGKREGRRQMLEAISAHVELPLVYVCCTGAQTELVFDGASMCFGSNGCLVKIAKPFDEDYFIFDTEEKKKTMSVVERSFEEEVYNALVYGLKDYCSKLGFNKVLVGLSGGIDSALVTVIAVEAMGRENVNVVLMPSKYSSGGSVKDSEKLIDRLGISSNNISIQPVVDVTLEQLKKSFGEQTKSITEENIQARVRGLYLMAFSNQNNSLLLTTGNKSELAVGYCTLYGDMCGGLAVIADLYKTDIYKISNYINRDDEIIPQEIIDKAPSAELKHNQKDQDSLPEYELLDKILRMYLEQNKEIIEITKIIGNADVVAQTLEMVDRNEFKRKQAAPALRVSNKAFGYGRRYPIVQGWR
ncbi:MAG: NAD+ synthase [Ignavibacteria bacterium CG2_30_36_16]|nr:NAD+ synthase [Ignavibacteria bacterium]OIP55471.1 MAG: NAD+ synthase [Ignavibacteria bacterium CG2_30_36_16]PJB01281.1 MAG: NAD+ synthase [Ignavibacteria bacterium CG_4_9_14_3_um_filter_36_18]